MTELIALAREIGTYFLTVPRKEMN